MEPNGFPLDGTYTCMLCYKTISGDEGWYDKYGNKCLSCQKAVNDGVVPEEVLNDRESWYSAYDLKDKFGWHYQTVKKMIREGKLNAVDVNGPLVFQKETNTFPENIENT